MNKVTTEQKFIPRAQTWNSFIDAAVYVKGKQTDLASQALKRDTKSGVVLVRNSTDDDLVQFEVISLGDLIITPEDNEQEFRSNLPVFELIKDELSNPFGILQKPLKKDEVGSAMLSGVTPVKLNLLSETHEFAELDDNGLKSTDSGSVRILWKESGTGDKWAVILLGTGGKASGEYDGAFKVGYEDGNLMLLGSNEDKGRYAENIIYLGLNKVTVPEQQITATEGYVYLEMTYSGSWQIKVKCGGLPSQTNEKIIHPVAYLKSTEIGEFAITQILRGILNFPGRIL